MVNKSFAAILCAGLLSAMPSAAETVCGTVLSGTSDSLNTAIVTLMPMGMGGGTAYLDTTDVHGRYSISGVAPGQYIVVAALEGYIMAEMPALADVQNDTVSVVYNIVMTAVTAGMTTVTGMVTDSSSRIGLPGVTIYLQQTGWNVDSAVTGSNGRYLIDSVRSGSYTVKAIVQNYVAKTSEFMVSDSGTDTIDFALQPVQYGAVTGKVTADSPGGSVLANAEIVISQLAFGGGFGGGTFPSILMDTVLSGSDGSYVFSHVASGDYEIRVSSPGYVSMMAMTTIVPTETDTVDFALQLIQYGSVTGRITAESSNGMPLENSQIILFQGVTGGGFGGPSISSMAVDTVLSGSDGSYSFSHVATGDYELGVSLAGYVSARVPTTITVTPTDTVNIFLTPAMARAKTMRTTKTLTATVYMQGGMLIVKGIANPATLTLFSLDGAQVYRTSLVDGQLRYAVPSHVVRNARVLIACIRNSTEVITQRLFIK